MLEVPIVNQRGEQIETYKLDERLLGSTVNPALLKQAVVTYHARQHQGSAATKSRAMVAGSTRKVMRQKGSGRARRGPIRTPLLRGGGHTFAKRPLSPRKGLPKKMRRAALRTAVLAKALGKDLLIVDALDLPEAKTKHMAEVVRALEINRSCLLVLPDRNDTVYRASRNLPDLTVRIVAELNAFEVATRQKMLLTREAMDAFLTGAAAPQEVTA